MIKRMLMTFISRPVVRTGVAAILLGSTTLVPSADTRAEAPLADCSQNAAIYYWKAASLIQTPTTQDELDYAGKADVLLADVSPAIFAAQPEMLQWLLNAGPMLPALRQARSCAICEFTIRTSSEPFLDLSHLPRLRALTRRAQAMAKAYEFVDNAPGAAAIYVDLLKMVQHLDQDRNLISGFVATELLQLNLSELESFFSRNPSAEAVAPLTEYFNTLPSPVFHPGNYLRDEVRRYGDWLLADPTRPEDRLNRLYRNTKSKPAIEKLMTLEPRKKQERLKGWVDDYRKRMNALAAAVDLPFASGLPRIRQLDEQKEAIQPSAPAPGDNPLVPLLVPTAVEMYQRFLLAEAQFDMLQILSAAAAYRAELGSWPANIDVISRHARRMMPRDPFSNDKFYYRIERGMPVLITRVPKRMMAQKGYSYLLGLHQRIRIDEENTINAAKGIREQAVRETNEPVPME
jgi:hypothetical protein